MFFKRISQNYLDNTGVVNNRNDDDNDAFHPLHVYLSSLENQVELAKIDFYHKGHHHLILYFSHGFENLRRE